MEHSLSSITVLIPSFAIFPAILLAVAGFIHLSIFDQITAICIGLSKAGDKRPVLSFTPVRVTLFSRGERCSLAKIGGFTLIELMIAVAITSILAALAIPAFSQYVTRGKAAEAISSLSQLGSKLERYYSDQTPPSYANAANNCGIALPPAEAKYFSYTCVTTGQTYTLTATGVAAEGMNGYTYTLDQAGTKSSTLPDGSTAACWRIRPGAGC